jgi:nitrite reductase/ring-hydroxylating ferredoxin subunit
MTGTNRPKSRGVDVDGLLKALAEGIDEGLVPASLYGNPEVYQRELRQIFSRCWVFMGHESELPNSGDYVVRKIGEDDFIVTRDQEGGINVLFDACRHRGVKVARASSGNTKGFVCPYHGWTYDIKGQLIGAPLWRSAFGDMDKSKNGLLPATQVDTYQGLIFATLDAEAPPLKTYLGGMTWYLDLVFGLNEHGIEVLGPPQRFVIDADWKSGADNFSGDDYHLGTLHRSAIDIGAFPVSFAENMKGYHIQASPGHSLSFSMAGSEEEPGPRFFGFPEELSKTFDTSRISEQQLAAARMSRVFVGNVFPNFSLLLLPTTDDAARHPATGMLTMRCWQPKGPGKIEVWNWYAGYKNMTPELKQRTYASGLATFSMGGTFEIDDTEPWITVARTGRSVAAETLQMDLNYQMGLPGVGIATEIKDDSWPGPGIVYKSRFEEGVQRNLYRFYAAMMQAPQGQFPSTKFDEKPVESMPTGVSETA